jgi:hypothetical protein
VDMGSGEVGLPGCSMESETSRSAGYDCDFAFETEDVCEVLELDVGFSGHDGRLCAYSV